MKNSEWIKEHLNTIFDDNADKIKKIGAVEEKLGFIKGKLYKYYSFEDEYSLSNLEEDIIHFSKSETFNDPFDCILSFSLERAIDMFYPMLIEKGIVPKIKNSSFKQLVRESFGNKNADIIDTVELIINKSHYFGAEGKKIRAAILEANEKLNEANKENFNMINNIFAISCFSESSDNIVMWSHYANKHTGFCVEYDFNDCDIKDFEIVCRLFPVTYSELRFQLSSNIFGLDNSNRIIFKSNPKAISELMMLFLTKSNIWEYENEWRIVHEQKYLDQNNNIKVPIAKSICLGANVSENNKAKIIDIAKRKNLGIYQYKKDKDHFKLNLKKL